MDKPMFNVAVYGTLKEGHGNNVLLQDSAKIGEGWIHGYKMVASGIPFVFKDEAVKGKVWVEVWQVDGPTLAQLDSLEGHPDWYYRSPVSVQTEQGEVRAEVYLNDQHNELPEVVGGVY